MFYKLETKHAFLICRKPVLEMIDAYQEMLHQHASVLDPTRRNWPYFNTIRFFKNNSSDIMSALRSTCDLLPEKLLMYGVWMSHLSTGHRLSTKNNNSCF